MNSRILIVDDDIDIQIALSEFLKDEGYQTQTVNNGREALDALAHGDLPDLILLDLMMPICDGVEFRNEQMKNAEWSKIPTILLSADGSLKEKAAKLGMNDVLKKPIGLTELFGTIKKYV